MRDRRHCQFPSVPLPRSFLHRAYSFHCARKVWSRLTFSNTQRKMTLLLKQAWNRIYLRSPDNLSLYYRSWYHHKPQCLKWRWNMPSGHQNKDYCFLTYEWPHNHIHQTSGRASQYQVLIPHGSNCWCRSLYRMSASSQSCDPSGSHSQRNTALRSLHRHPPPDGCP